MKKTPATSKTALNSRSIAKKIAHFASDKKAEDIIVLDMRKVVNFCDYFVICSGNTDRQVRAISDCIDEGLSDMGVKVGLKEGTKNNTWVVYDVGDVVAHIFQKDLRGFYNLEHLWQEAAQVNWNNN